MSTPAPAPSHKLFEYVIAAMLRASGYVAGVPIRRIGGRGTTHQIDVIGIEFTHLPFLYDTVLLVEAKCYDPGETVGIDVVRQVKSNVVDLEQTLPRALNLLPRNIKPVQFFVRVFGKKDGEGLTACYRGAIFTTGKFSRYAREFAYAHGIYLFNFPQSIAGRRVVDWIKTLEKILFDFAGKPSSLRMYFPTAKKTRLNYYSKILQRFRENHGDLEPNERHYLFTVIRNLLRKNENLRPFWEELRNFCLVDLNGYPALTQLLKRRSIHLVGDVLRQYHIGAEKRRRRRKYGTTATISDMKLTKRWSERLDEDLYEVGFLVTDEKSEPILEGRTFVHSFLNEFFEMGKILLTLPIAQGLYLVARSAEGQPQSEN
jgi:hypothetical protein